MKYNCQMCNPSKFCTHAGGKRRRKSNCRTCTPNRFCTHAGRGLQAKSTCHKCIPDNFCMCTGVPKRKYRCKCSEANPRKTTRILQNAVSAEKENNQNSLNGGGRKRKRADSGSGSGKKPVSRYSRSIGSQVDLHITKGNHPSIIPPPQPRACPA